MLINQFYDIHNNLAVTQTSYKIYAKVARLRWIWIFMRKYSAPHISRHQETEPQMEALRRNISRYTILLCFFEVQMLDISWAWVSPHALHQILVIHRYIIQCLMHLQVCINLCEGSAETLPIITMKSRGKAIIILARMPIRMRDAPIIVIQGFKQGKGGGRGKCWGRGYSLV